VPYSGDRAEDYISGCDTCAAEIRNLAQSGKREGNDY
jgi:hypothetical protein